VIYGDTGPPYPGRWMGQHEDRPADLGEDVYAKLKAAIADKPVLTRAVGGSISCCRGVH
jgi:hypothetical protein